MDLKRIIAVDLDGTILKNKKPFMGADDFGKPERKVEDCLRFLKNHGFEILIHTTRVNPRLQGLAPALLRMRVSDALDAHKIPFDGIWTGPGKPLAEFYVDDRGVLYAGDWEKTMREILARAEKNFKNVY
ncbi:hypothetical protein LCGC14_0460970 [marine sediment metagenome]|uniref:Capsular biosynthesis protein n=1 Tax=marine sediment metagenome TaxID=412755 RepID=A0A0F9SF50_9ZZZZ|nr:hypothetical protein [bacterium]